MGGTIRYSMVATTVLAMLLMALPALGQSGFAIPPSLGSGTGQSSNSAAGGASTAAQSSPGQSSPGSFNLPGFTGGVNEQRATPRAGGPTTEPTNSRNSFWLRDNANQNGQRPSTAPYSAAPATTANSDTTNQQLSSKLLNDLRNAQVSNVAAPPTQQGGSAATDSRSSTTSGFATVPKGIAIPPAQGTTQGQSGSFGSEFARGQAGASSAGQVVYGPKTAAQANFDPSIYNTNQYQGTANQTAATANTAGPANSALGMPASINAGGAAPTKWTSAQIIALGEKFNIPSNDPRLRDQSFVNHLYAQWSSHQSQTQSAGSNTRATTTNAGGSASPGWGQTVGSNSTPPSLNGLNLPSPPSSSAMDALNGQGKVNSQFQDRIAGDSTATSRTSPGRRKPLFDRYGNPVDRDGNILGEDGQPVDDATAFDLTHGKKLREEMARLREEQAELERKNKQLREGSPSDRIASNGGVGSPFRNFGPGGFASDAGHTLSNPDLTTHVQRPATSDSGSRPDDAGGRPQPDQAGIAGSAKAIGKSNPYVNVFLLCSLVANAFLFISLHRLWYHHRDLIASSRMAASGISTND